MLEGDGLFKESQKIVNAFPKMGDLRLAENVIMKRGGEVTAPGRPG